MNIEGKAKIFTPDDMVMKISLEKVIIIQRVNSLVQFYIIGIYEQFNLVKNRSRRIDKQGKEERGENSAVKNTRCTRKDF